MKHSSLYSAETFSVKHGIICIRNISKLPDNIQKKLYTIVAQYKQTWNCINDIVKLPQFITHNNQQVNLAVQLGKALPYTSPKVKRLTSTSPTHRIIEAQEPRNSIERARQYAAVLQAKKDLIIQTLTTYETHAVALDEFGRTIDLLTNLSENAMYFSGRVHSTTVFLPRNQPLYTFVSFAVVPAFMSTEVHLKPPASMKHLFFDLMDVIEINTYVPNIHFSHLGRQEFIEERSRQQKNFLSTKTLSTDVVIFTGKPQNGNILRKKFHPNTLFIMNGAAHNPIVVTEDADIRAAVDSACEVVLYNQGQDCAAPNSILVHQHVLPNFINELRSSLEQVVVGDYHDPKTRVGPITCMEDLARIQKLFIEHKKWLDPSTPGVIHTAKHLVYPTIIVKPLKDGGHYNELFAPIFMIQPYERDGDLAHYFENRQYAPHAGYITVFGESKYVNSLIDQPLFDGTVLHDTSTIIHNTNLHAPGIERGTKPYGGYGRNASCVSINGIIDAKPTLPQREIYEYLIQNQSSQ